MDFLNYHHLRYFWVVAQEGSLRKAAQKLSVSQPTISAQIAALEEMLGEKLFHRTSRGLALTEIGQQAFSYAKEIFDLGQEFLHSVKHRGTSRPLRVHIGVADSLPKQLSHEIIKPIFNLGQPVQAACMQGKTADLLAQLAVYRLDLVLANEPAPSSLHVRVFNHLLGDCGVTFCAAPSLVRKLKPHFPQSLNQAPVLLPTSSPLRRSLENWFQTRQLRPRLVAEYDDAALMKVAAVDGLGAFPLPNLGLQEAVQRYGFEVVAEVAECREQFYAISADPKVTHPAVMAITASARTRLFGASRSRAWALV
ncbi:MAG TPA: LysR family transcriptional regulator [Candidatus Sulfotelmatobacter sp.]|nr:LysR family transcriptional regulator [Candidatus Sulfotelmatobacter sp.]